MSHDHLFKQCCPERTSLVVGGLGEVMLWSLRSLVKAWRKWGVEKKQVVEDHTECQPQVVGWALEKVGA